MIVKAHHCIGTLQLSTAYYNEYHTLPIGYLCSSVMGRARYIMLQLLPIMLFSSSHNLA